MKGFSSYKIPALALLCYGLLYGLFYNSLQYLLDSDAVAYLTIARRLAAGDWFKSINGLWSPLNSWLLVPFIKSGYDAWAVSKALNAFFGGVLILQFWNFLNTLRFNKKQIAVGTFVVVIPVCFFVYFQMYGDVLQLVFAIAFITLALRKDFILNRNLVLLAALLMGIGFYAKAYSLIFFVLFLGTLAMLAMKKNGSNVKLILTNYFFGLLVVILLVLPWGFQLQKKYSEFALTGMAGKLNMSWYINSGKTFNDSIGLLIPPPYEDSPSFWEDPYLSAGELSTPFTSAYHFKRWGLRVGHTCLMAIKSVCEISLFFIPIFLLFFYRLVKRRKINKIQKKLLWAMILLPLGYLAMHIETRYIWLSLFLLIPLGFYWLEELAISEGKRKLLYLVFGISIIAFPLFKLFDLNEKNKNLFVLADELKANNIKGKIVTNLNDEGSFWIVSYLAGLTNYTIEEDQFDYAEMVKEMQAYKITYYYHFMEGEEINTAFKNQLVSHFQLVFKSKNTDAQLYILKN